MPKRIAAAAALIAVLALAGCASEGSSEDASTERSATSAESSPEATNPTTETTEALSAEDQGFLDYVEAERPPATSIGDMPSEDLIALGREACTQISAGVAFEDLRLVDGESPSPGGDYLDTSAIFNGALYNYCPELTPDMGS